MAQPASPIGRIAERIGGTNKVVSSTSVSEVLYRTDIGCVIERLAVAPMDVPPVMGIATVTVGIASDWQRKQTKKHKRGQTFHGNQIFCTRRTMITRSRISPAGFISPATSS
jgi:hypothetical protein